MENAPDKFEYDVAFSFHQSDQGLAQQLNDLLQDRFKTFIYTEQQKFLAGTDGEVTFNAVYGGKARVVVVFYRKEWGLTPFTRIEETAIRKRAFHKGYGFTLFIPTDEPPTAPEWLPPTQLWFGLKTFGLDVAAGVVEHKIQTLGGEPSIESASDRAKRFTRAEKLRRDQSQFLKSDKGYAAATAAYDEFVEALAEGADAIADDAGIRLMMKPVPSYQSMRVFYGLGTVLVIGWEPKYLNEIEDCPVRLEYYSHMPALPGFMPPHSTPRSLRVNYFQYEMLGPDRYGYVDKSNRTKSYSPTDLSSLVLKTYIDIAERNPRD
ncbi:hypothetical protein [Aureimonas glaciei]|uniref:TIR domain-containing protein n=1 Tax=Aureimonas glaciei TaxID=1776957 RepID=A0A917DF15_9HYPH|nr:hypothetical protein [Aureimonas glaciei]GGD31504.1 hypothetical protein GCM10011335_38170 [Aureimonas glaciei]